MDNTYKPTELELLIIDLINCSQNASMDLWDELWKVINEKFGTKLALEIYNKNLCYVEPEEDFLRKYMLKKVDINQ